MTLMKLFPTPVETVPLERLYLNHNLRAVRDPSRPFVYTNFIASLDGRIALECPRTGTAVVPDEIANARDWRLFEELAAQADVLLTTGRYVRQLARGDAQATLPLSEEAAYQDLRDWRQAQGLAAQPAVVVLSASLDIPLIEPLIGRHGRVYIATGSDVDAARVRAIEARGARVIVAGQGTACAGSSLDRGPARGGFESHLFDGGTQSAGNFAVRPGTRSTLPDAGAPGPRERVLRYSSGRTAALPACGRPTALLILRRTG